MSTNIVRGNISNTSFTVGMNSLQEVMEVCVSVLYQETRNSKLEWLLIMDIDIETSKASLIVASIKMSVVAGMLNASVAQPP